ncbi:hypothetical protein ACKLNO_01270 [Neisseriaceae bacterium B1]
MTFTKSTIKQRLKDKNPEYQIETIWGEKLIDEQYLITVNSFTYAEVIEINFIRSKTKRIGTDLLLTLNLSNDATETEIEQMAEHIINFLKKGIMPCQTTKI